MNGIFLILILLSVIIAACTGGWNALSEARTGTGQQVMNACLAMGGGLMLWCGAMKIVEQGGLLADLSRWLRPVLKKLFPGIPPNDEAMHQISANLAANMLGVGNAATPAGLRAMRAMQERNPDADTPSDAMCMFLAINTSSVQLFPTMLITLRAGAGSANPADIVPAVFLATAFSTAVSICLMKAAISLERKRTRNNNVRRKYATERCGNHRGNPERSRV